MAFNLINFKKGTLAGLETLKTNNGVQEGTFYLTIDSQKQTSRLFIGTAADTALPVNSNISIVTNTSDLEAAGAATPFNDGDFAYVSNGNILAVKIGNAWHQINAPDSRAVKSLTPEISTSSGTATIQWKLRDQDGNIIPEADPSNPANVVANSIPDITLTGANGITVSSNDDDLTITGTSYEMSSAAVVANSNEAIIKLQSKDSATATAADVSSISIKGGTNVDITGNANEVVIAAQDTVLSSVTGAAAASGTGFTVTVTDTDGNNPSGTIDPKITLGTHTAAGDQIGFTAGVANLPVYTKNEIDNMNRALDALVYKGLISGSSLITQTSGLEIGYTYKASEDFTLSANNSSTGNAVSVKTGDLVIVSSSNTETNGTISGNSIKYDVIPSGDDFYVFKGLGTTNHTGNGIQIEDGNSTILSSIEIAQGNQITVSSVHTDYNSGDGAKAVVTVAHSTISSSTTGDANTPSAVGTAQSTHSSQTFDVVTGLTTSNGHVTGTTVERIQVVDTVSHLDVSAGGTGIAVSTPASGQTDYNKAATVTSSIKLADEDGTVVPNSNNQNVTDLAFTLRSDNLQITASGSTITANYVWGTFGD